MENKKISSCLFCEITTSKGKSFIVLENDICVAFLDHRPLFPGHCLLIPKQHIPTLLDLPQELVEPFFEHVQLIAKAVEDAMTAEGSFVAINNRISQSVPHLHVHIVPRNKGDGLKGFFWPRNKYRDEEHMAEVQRKIKKSITKFHDFYLGKHV
jgi:histidine triad (HIT) family protein